MSYKEETMDSKYRFNGPTNVQINGGQAGEGVVKKALDLIEEYGWIDGGHHKTWVLDQIARALTGDGYEAWVAGLKDGEDGPDTYGYDEGIAP